MSSLSFSTLLPLLHLLSPATAGKVSDCAYTNTKYGVTFNFYQLQLLSNGQLPYYAVDDSEKNQDDESLYTYYFNLCAPVLSLPNSLDICSQDSSGHHYSYCPDSALNTSAIPNKCTVSDTSHKIDITNLAFAYQVNEDESQCYPLSGAPSSPNDYSNYFEYSLYDELDPTQGVKIHFTNGAWADGECGANRELTVNLKCEDDPATIPAASDVVEYAPCKYMLEVPTMHGCPAGCAAYANSLCAAQGLCGYDFSSNRSRCFCYWGFTGSACERVDSDYTFTLTNAKSDHHGQPHTVTLPSTQPMTDAITGMVVNKQVNVTYDLSDVSSSEMAFQIDDTSDTNKDYQFYFNIGGTINSEKLLPAACQQVLMPCRAQNKTACDIERSDNSKTSPGDIGYAFRYLNGSKTGANDSCILLGTQFADYSLYDNVDDPAHGITVHYVNGSYSAADSSDEQVVNCGIMIDLVCPDTRVSFFEPASSGVVKSEAEVEFLGECQHRLEYETAFACPYNCLVQTKSRHFSVCSGHGMCAADPSAGFVRCLCDENYYDNDCSKEWHASSSSTSSKKHSDTGFAVALSFISILLIGFVIGVVYLYMRNKTLEKYAVPILDDHEQIEPRVPDYSDSDSEHFHNRPKIGSASQGAQEMVTVTAQTNTNANRAQSKKRSGKIKSKKQGNKQYSAQLMQDDEDGDLSDDDNVPNAYLAANPNDDDDSDTD